MSSLVYLKDPSDKKIRAELLSFLEKLRDEGLYGFSKIFTKEEARAEHLDGDFEFVLESDGYTSFSDSCRRPLVPPMDLSDFRFGRATHGYFPSAGPQPVFLAKGPHIVPGAKAGRHVVVDEAPTYAALLGIDLPDADGRPIAEFLA